MRLALTLTIALALGACTRRVSDLCGAAYCLSVGNPQHAPGVGRGQGVEVRDGVIWVFGDAETGVARAFRLGDGGVLEATGESIALTLAGKDLVSHPTGLTFHEPEGTFLGNTIEKKGRIYKIDWAAALAAKTLDGAVLAVALDDAAVNGSRPELVRANGRWLVASADYGGSGRNEVRLYDPDVLAKGVSTSASGAIVAKFPVGEYVQALHYWEARDVLVLVQNRRLGRGWRLTLLDLAASVQSGKAVVLDVLEPVLPGELEGFHFVDGSRALLVTSAAVDNAWPASLTSKQP